MQEDLTIEVRGEPIPQPRPQGRIVGRGRGARVMIYTPAVQYVVGKKPNGENAYCSDRLVPWKKSIARAAREVIPSGIIAGFGPVELEFFLPRTEELRKAKHSDAPIPCRSRYYGDVDNLAKTVLDALTKADALLSGDDTRGGIWGDDAEVYELRVTKRYVARDPDGAEYAPGVRITIRAATPEAAPALFAGATNA